MKKIDTPNLSFLLHQFNMALFHIGRYKENVHVHFISDAIRTSGIKGTVVGAFKSQSLSGSVCQYLASHSTTFHTIFIILADI